MVCVWEELCDWLGDCVWLTVWDWLAVRVCVWLGVCDWVVDCVWLDERVCERERVSVCDGVRLTLPVLVRVLDCVGLCDIVRVCD